MKRRTTLILTLLVAPLLLSAKGCGTTSTGSVVIEPQLAAIPVGLKRECDQAVELPDPMPNPGDPKMIKLWGADRAALGDCRRRHKALAEAVTALEQQQ